MKELADELFVWTPGSGVGPIKFGEDIGVYLDHLPIRMGTDLSDRPALDLYVHGDEEEPAYYVDEHNRVRDIVCFYALIYQGNDLLGLKLDEVVRLLGVAPDEYGKSSEMPNDDLDTIAEFDSLGLQLWFHEGISDSAVVSEADELLPTSDSTPS